MRLAPLAIPLVGFFLVPLSHGADWKDLLPGNDLSGWEVKGWSQEPGVADFYVEDGTIVGVSKLGVPNSFLCPEETYRDFILEFDVLVDVSLNSGVQFRSLTDPKYRNGQASDATTTSDPA